MMILVLLAPDLLCIEGVTLNSDHLVSLTRLSARITAVVCITTPGLWRARDLHDCSTSILPTELHPGLWWVD
jgi:hypothetical protein